MEFYYSFPHWVVTAWGIAVWGGVLGSLFLLFRKCMAVHVFLLSFICMILVDARNFAFFKGFEVMGGVGGLIFTAIILLIGALLMAYARAMRKRGLLS